MKKAAFKFKSGFGPVLAFIVLGVVFATLVGFVWVVISQSPGKTPHAQTVLPQPNLSLPVNWNMPAGYVSFVDTGNKKANCQSAGTTCSTATYTYWPGSTVNYYVQVNSSSGSVLQNGTTIATPDGRAVANWNWRYEVNVFPDSFGSCAAAADNCVKGQTSSNTFVASNLLPSTLYRLIVCSPVCVGGTVIQNTTAKTADVIMSWVLQAPLISAGNVNFTFSPVSNGNISLIVKNASGGASGGTIVFDSGPIPSGKSSVGLNLQSGIYTAVLVFGTAAVSNTITFTSSGIPPVSPPPLTACTFINFSGKVQKYGDVNNNTYVNTGDATLVKRSIAGIDPPLVGDAKKAADVNGDLAITTADADLINQFYFKVITNFPACPLMPM